MAKTPNISKTQISESLITSLFLDPKNLSKGLQSTWSTIEMRLKQMCNQKCMKHQSKNLQIPFLNRKIRSLSLRKRWAFTPHSPTPQSPRHLQHLALTSSSPQGFHRTEWSFRLRRSHLRLEGRSTWLPKISRDTRLQMQENQECLCHLLWMAKAPNISKRKLLSFLMKLHILDLQFTDRQKTSITSMSMPSGLNGKGTKHLKDANLRESNYKSLSRPQKFIKVATITMLQIRNSVFWYQDYSKCVQKCMKHQSKYLQISFSKPPELTLRNLSLNKHWTFKPHSATPQSPWHLHTFALMSSSPQGFHRTEWSGNRRRSHLRLEGRSTWLSTISRHTRCKNIKNVYSICSEWQRHQTSQKRKSRKLHKSLSRPQKRIQGTAITTDIQSRPQQLQRSSPARHLHFPLPTNPGRRCFRPSGGSCPSPRLHLRGAEAELWSDSGNATETSFWRSILPGLDILEKTHNMQHWPRHIPTILQPLQNA